MQFLWEFTVILLFHDMSFYLLHYVLHSSYMYRHYHSLHHEIRYTFSVASEYSHPVEFSLSVTTVLVGPLILQSHIFTMYLYMVLQMAETTLAHCGYQLIPSNCLLDSREHAYHHSHIQSMYGSWFTLVDKLFKTDIQYKQYKEKLQQQDKDQIGADTKSDTTYS